jgi:hypothetical protein
MQMQIPVSIRSARREDGVSLLSMLAELAAWEGAMQAPLLSALQRWIEMFSERIQSCT